VLERFGDYVAAETLALELAEGDPEGGGTSFASEGAELTVGLQRA
jgi:hypothetical protein